MSGRDAYVRTILGGIAGVVLLTIASVGCSEILLEENPKPIVLVGEDGENNAVLCADGVDNDGDGFIDCDDPQCLVTGDPETDPECEQVPNSACPGRVVCVDSENTDKLCSDGIDNNGNGFLDCQDAGCERNLAITVCGIREPEDTNAACSDGIDNDKNGFTDCQDFGCARNSEVSVCCTPTAQREDSEEACIDGRDNDCNGFTDCRDFGCSQSNNPDVAELCATTSDASETDCGDGEDNDRDGHTDCADWDCNPPTGTPDPECVSLEPEDTEARCSDNIDNDKDGLVDCRDWTCWSTFSTLCR